MKSTMKRWLLALSVALSASGCHDFEIETPHGFVELENPSYDYQATDAAGVVLAIREFETHDAGRQFWEQAVAGQMQRLGSYELQAEKDVQTRDGTKGKLLSFARRQDGKDHAYAVAVFVKQDPFLLFDRERLFVVESGGEEVAYRAQQAALERSLASLDLDLLW